MNPKKILKQRSETGITFPIIKNTTDWIKKNLKKSQYHITCKPHKTKKKRPNKFEKQNTKYIGISENDFLKSKNCESLQ